MSILGKEQKPPKDRVLFKDKQHVPGVEGSRGLPGEALLEPVPDFAKRTGDCVINAKTLKQGVDNNTMIILGRDRSGLGEIFTKDSVNLTSGYGASMGAGAIDIVVGRMSPYPINSYVNDPDNRSLKVGPSFKTKEYPEDHPLRQVDIANYNQDGEEVKGFKHPGVVLDAARIYISQMSLIDEYFGIAKNISTSNNAKNESSSNKSNSVPSSAIMIKADEVRLHSRKDIKIVTGGPGTKYDSQGNLNTLSTGKIHLMAGNLAQSQQPVVLGNNLVEMLNEFLKVFEDYVNNVNAFVTQQLTFNAAVTGHVHTELGATGMPCLPSLMTLKFGAETTYFQLANNVIGGGLAIGTQIQALKTHVIRGTAKINSNTVTTS